MHKNRLLLLFPLLAVFSLHALTFEEIRDRILVFETRLGKRLGILVAEGKDTYAVTSQSGLMGNSRMIIRDLQGKVLEWKTVEPASNTDLIRFQLQKKKAGVSLLTMPFLEDPVLILCIDSRTGIITEAQGTVFNDDKLQVENDAALDFSGAMLVNADQQLVGIFAQPQIDFQPETWFPEDAKPVPGSVPLGRSSPKTIWRPTTWQTFTKQAGNVSDAEVFLERLVVMLNCWTMNPYAVLDYTNKRPKGINSWLKDHNKMARDYPIICDRLKKTASAKTRKNVSGYKLKGQVSENAKRLVNHCRSRKKAMMGSSKWVSSWLEREAKKLARLYFHTEKAIQAFEAESVQKKSPFSFRGVKNYVVTEEPGDNDSDNTGNGAPNNNRGRKKR